MANDWLKQGYHPQNPDKNIVPGPSRPQIAAPAQPAPVAPDQPRRPAPAVQRAPRRAAQPARRRSTVLLIGCIVASLCLLYVLAYMFHLTGSAMRTDSAAEGVAGMLVTAMAVPYAIACGVGTLFAWLGWAMQKRPFALVAAVLFAVSMILMIPWFMFSVVQCALCFVAFARMKKQ